MVVASSVGPHEMIAGRGGRLRVRGDCTLEVPALSFAILSAAFSSTALCLSEPGTGIRCIDLATGDQLWHHRELGANSVAFNSSDGSFYCVGGLDKSPKETAAIRLAPNLADCVPVVTCAGLYGAVLLHLAKS